ncbi:acetyl-CoA carboxylase biotin carboxylase subunit [Candidatus Sumerlaeota bacterium]|nr:acetyl-CoA carboxylase biotin carboxylase subunit [Candidatus Sumerlaeota bacterium]
MPPFNKVLIANRGEIACRVIRAVQARGYRAVAVASEADADAPHVRLADESVIIGPGPVAESYLSIERIGAAAKKSGADAIHPGYGFLSENEDFALACAEAGLVFIGPTPEAIQLMGNKAEAKRRMIEAGVPCVPGYQGEDQSDATMIAEAAKIGYPVMVKAAAGGGGRGMRLVRAAEDLPQALNRARAEAEGAFGSGELILEKAIIAPRHVEIQIIADTHGNVVHLGERDCSVQRRHQKVIEESPCPVMTQMLRAEMGGTAVVAAQSIGYVGAGTMEFLLNQDGNYYFLEMNTRLQVEHPVTELVTGLDLVGLQLDVAAGKSLPFRQADIQMNGAAIEVRLYAEDPYNKFLPQAGRVIRWSPPRGEGVRVDDGIVSGSEISPYYDPMLAKIIAWGSDREEARRRLIRALENTGAFGVVTNRDFLLDLLRDDIFAAGQATTALIGERFGDEPKRPDISPLHVSLAAVLLIDQAEGNFPPILRNWRSTGVMETPVTLRCADRKWKLAIHVEGNSYQPSAGEEALPAVRVLEVRDGRVRFESGGVAAWAAFAMDSGNVHLDLAGRSATFEDATYAPAAAGRAGSDGTVRAPMSGKIVAVNVKPGDAVELDQPLLILESMKMENHVLAPVAGEVESVSVAVGDQVGKQQVVVKLKPLTQAVV